MDRHEAPLAKQLLSGLLVLAVLALGFTVAFSRLRYAWHWEAVWEYRGKLLSGWLVTVAVSLAALCGSLLCGVGAALARRSRLLPLRQAAALYVEGVRGTPLLVQILILYYIVGDALGLENRYVAGVLILALFSGAYVGEIVRAGIEGVGASQWETARALGFTPAQTSRPVVLPQAMR
ncbi:MAG TPA: ABC transporter permease subunit, partial [Candidatus Methylacidiphilales bacterium]